MTDDPDALALLHRLEAATGSGTPSHVLMDGARVKALPEVLAALDASHVSLYSGPSAIEWERVAPFLVVLSDALIEWLANDPAALETALFIVSDAATDDLRLHFRRFLRVRDASDMERYFRFYDPRVVEPLLAASTPEETAAFFGPVTHLIVVAEISGARVWRAPVVAHLVAPTDAFSPFRLRRQHEAAFARDGLNRYERRVVQWLRDNRPDESAGLTDADLRRLVTEARALAQEIEVNTGEAASLIADYHLVRGSVQPVEDLTRHPPTKRASLLRNLHASLEPEVAGATP